MPLRRAGDDRRYLGKSEVIDDAIASFAMAYADQTVADHAALVKAKATKANKTVKAKPVTTRKTAKAGVSLYRQRVAQTCKTSVGSG